ncbi:MAG TPA: hypothetical protein VHW06_15475 [Streptosporangiaceae bacterium]|nr:hypothetical protein [Streptosporangiaceae bacterium]
MNEILATPGWFTRAEPASVLPVTRLTVPGGRPAAVTASMSRRAAIGVSGAGLITVVQPASRAGPSLRMIRASGKFHGVISPATPSGRRWTRARPGPRGLARTSVASSSPASPATWRR